MTSTLPPRLHLVPDPRDGSQPNHPAPRRAAAPAPEVPVDPAVVRLVRRQVAESLTEANRQSDVSGVEMAAEERADLVHRLIAQALDSYANTSMQASRPVLSPAAEAAVARSVRDVLLGMGGLQPLLDDDRIEDITAEGCDDVMVRYADGTREKVGPIADTDEDLIDLIRTLAARTGRDERRFDRASPILDLQLPDGSRLHATMEVTPRPSLAIRRHRLKNVTLAELRGLGMFDERLEAFLRAAVLGRCNILFAGELAVGKTTLMNACTREIPYHERLVTIEDSYELNLHANTDDHIQVKPMQIREANVEGEGAVGMDRLFRSNLRSAGDRVFVGEVRGGEEVVHLLNVMSQGSDGSMSTIHASSSAGVFEKLVMYAAMSAQRFDPQITNLLIAASVHLVVHLDRDAHDRRCITSIREVTGAEGVQVSSNELWRPNEDGRATPAAPMSTKLAVRLRRTGYDTTAHLNGTPAGGR